MSGEQTFWSRRRTAVQAEDAATTAAIEAEALAEHHTALADRSEAEVLTELNLPDPDTLLPGDDFAAFMAKAVPETIRRRALRTLWRSNPVLANVDMLVDYGEDFTDSAMAVENLQTAYQVGKGMLKHVEEMARQAAERENPAPAEEEIDDTPASEELIALAPDNTPAQQMEDAPEPGQDMDDLPPAPRRMTFRIEETA